MQLLGSLIHTAPSAQYTHPTLTSMQLVWKHICDHIVDRGDTYKRDAFSELENSREELPGELYSDLRIEHDTWVFMHTRLMTALLIFPTYRLSVQREVLLDSATNPTMELVAKSNAYKNAAKALHAAVQVRHISISEE